MVVAPHVDLFAWSIGVEEVDVENALHRFVDPARIPLLVSDDMVWHPVCRPYHFSDVGRVPLAPAKGSESNSYPF
jgi:hypothetical protein